MIIILCMHSKKILSLTFLSNAFNNKLLSTVNNGCLVLKNKSLIKIAGSDSFSFLQGLITNDILHFEHSDTNLLYTYILNPQGRILYDAYIFKLLNNGTPILFLECDKIIKENLIKHLKKFIIRKKIDVCSEDKTNVGVILPENNQTSESLATLNMAKLLDQSQKPLSPFNILCKDPRCIELGLRGLINSISENIISEDDAYIKQRYKIGIGEGVIDHPPEKCLPLESNGDLLNAISFTKGCYVGQELTSRTHNMGVIRKRLLPITFTDPDLDPKLQIPAGADIVTESGLKCGTYRNRSGCYGLALMRLKESLGKKLALYHDGKEYSLTTHLPEWMKLE